MSVYVVGSDNGRYFDAEGNARTYNERPKEK